MAPGSFPPAPGPGPAPPTAPTPEPVIPDIPTVDDWHYPAEEPREAATELALALQVVSVSATSNNTGSITVSCGSSGSKATASTVGDVVFGWVLRGFLVGEASRGQGPTSPSSADATTSAASMAVLERNWDRWGYIAFASASTPLCRADTHCFRKGVGTTTTVRRPRYNLTAVDPTYFADAAGDPHDFVRRGMEQMSRFNETTFASAASLLPPTHDYAIVGNVASHTKFSIAQDGRVRLANYSIYSPTQVGNVTEGKEAGVLLFDPRLYVDWWPTTNFSEYKTSLINRYSRAIVVAAWDTTARRGFSFEAVPDVHRGIETNPYDESVLLVRLVSAEVPATARYFAVRGCVTKGSPVTGNPNMCDGPPVQELADDGGRFHANLIAYCGQWAEFHQGGGTQVQLGYDASEAARIVDMARGTVTDAMTTFVGNRPNYGSGTNYWSVSQKDRGSLPLESYALDHALLLWGHTAAAADRIGYYFQHYVRGPSGNTPEPLPDAPGKPGLPGSIDLKHWDGNCGFADSYADYGRWIDLWVATARAQEAAGAPEWIVASWPQVKLMAGYMLELRANVSTTGLGKGLIYGPAEHDTCRFEAIWFSISAWTWRGFVQLHRFLTDTAAISEPALAATLVREADAFKADLDAALKASATTDSSGRTIFVPPYVAANFTPYTSMVQESGTPQQLFGGGPSYSNFRYGDPNLESWLSDIAGATW